VAAALARSVPELFDQLYPGFMRRVLAYIAETSGEFLEPTLCHPPEARYDGDNQLQRVQMAIRIRMGERTVLQVACRARREGSFWRLTYRSFHFGPSSSEMDLVYFRIDDSQTEPFHAHVKGFGPKPEKGGHIPIGEVEPPPGFPPLAHVDPISFLDLVDWCRAHKRIPLTVKKSK
jgi:hypothetical protein